MSERDVPRAYRVLLRLFPAEFRHRWGDEMAATFARMLELAGSWWGRAGVWSGGILDAVGRGIWLRALARSRGGRTDAGPGARAPRRGEIMGTWIADIRYGARSLARRRLFLVTAVITLALGIGANTAIFSVVNGLLISPLPYPDDDRLVMVYAEHQEMGWSGTDSNLADSWAYRSRAGVFEDLAVYDAVALNLTGGDRPELLSGIQTTPNLFDVLGVEPALGRGFNGADARTGGALAVVLTHGFWQRRFGANPNALGSTVVLDDEPGTVVGVLAPDFAFSQAGIDVYVPLRIDPATAPHGDHNRHTVARLVPGVDVARAGAAVNEVARQLQEEFPASNEGWTASVVGLREDLVGDIAKRASFVLMAAVGFVLLMACTNVANLLLAHANGRRTEMAVRAALGAGRVRILRQLLVESGLLALIAGVAGVGVAYVGERALVSAMPATLPPAFGFGLDRAVLAFAALASLVSLVLFAVLPAVRATRPAPEALREGGRSGRGGRSTRRFGSVLVVAQTALAVVLLVGGGVLVRSVLGMANQDMGFDAEGVLTVRMTPPATRYADDAALQRFWDDVMRSVRALPGVEAAGAIQALPLAGSNWGGAFTFEDEPTTDDSGFSVRHGYVTTGYFDALSVAVLRGRDVTASDGPDAPLVALVNQTFERQYAAGEDVIGRRVLSSAAGEPVQIVGVVEDHLERGIDQPPEPAIYFAMRQHVARNRTLAIRAAGGPTSLVDAVQSAVWTVDPDQPIYQIRTMSDWVDYRVAGFRLIAQIMGVFGLLSLMLGGVGIYGVTAYGAGQRSPEIGIRMAVGANRRQVIGLVLRDGMLRAAIGLLLGVALALPLSMALGSLLIGISPTDPLTYFLVLGTIALVSFLASWLPARRISGIDPMSALSAE